jgi:hypothetical protein
MQFFTLSVGEYTLQRELDLQTVFAFQLLAVVVFDFDGNASQRDVFLLRIELEGQGFTGSQCGVEVIVGLWRRTLTALSLGQVGEEFMVVDLDAVTKTFAGLGIDGKAPLVISLIGSWGIGLPIGALLASYMDNSVVGLWLGLGIGSAFTTGLYLLRFKFAIKNLNKKYLILE